MAAVALAAIVAPAHGQAVWLGTSAWPEYARRDVPRLARELDLDGKQVVILEVLLADYLEAFHAGVAAIQAWESAGANADPADAAAAARKATIRDELATIHEDVKALRRNAGGVDVEIDNDARDRIKALRAEWVELSPDPEVVRQARAERQTQLMRHLADHLTEWMTDRAELDDLFVSELRAVLTPEQRRRWDELVRTSRRERAIRAGLLSGERVDLDALVTELEDALELDLRADPGLAGELASYEADLDEALRARDAYMSRSHPELLRATADGDRDAQQSIMERRIDLRVAVRDLNDAYVVAFADALGGEPAAALLELHGRRAYGRAYRPTTLDRTFALIAHRSDIPPPVRAELDTLKAAYRAELRSIQAALVEAIRQAEPEAYRRRLDHIAPSRGPAADQVTAELTAQRAGLTEAYAERVRALLPTPS